MASLLVDFELGEEAMADESEGVIDRFRAGIGERDGSSCSLVVTSGCSHAVNDNSEDFSRVASEVGDPDGELHEVAEEADREGPVHPIEADEEVGEFGDDIGLGDDLPPSSRRHPCRGMRWRVHAGRWRSNPGRAWGFLIRARRSLSARGKSQSEGAVVERAGLSGVAGRPRSRSRRARSRAWERR